ncbi:putative phage integrase (plasmid) [Aliivibrio wodanis]|uniref:Putative phage integrase n=1 Tax=Aliivibrio wodanis TaxID=80852 RepID=A0A090K2S9_9GAMM|nr:putative phage integrase [Aliivibrio wodanis]
MSIAIICFIEKNNMRITSTCRSERANPDARNFGLRSKDPAFAAANAAQEEFNAGEIGGVTKDLKIISFNAFLNFHEDHDNKIKDLRKIESSHLQSYSEHLHERIENEEITGATAGNYISHIETLLNQIRDDDAVKFDSSARAELSRDNTARLDREVSRSTLEDVKSHLNENHSAMLSLQRELGLRFEESAKFNATAALSKIEAGAKEIKIEAATTKGGRPRCIPFSPSAASAIAEAAEIQESARSMIPPDLSYKTFRNECYNSMQNEEIKHHALRHTYAYNEYRESWTEKGYKDIEPPVKSGIEPPIAGDRADMQRYRAEKIDYLQEKTGLSRNEVKEIEREIRLDVSEKLGHSRVAITNKYLG